MPRRGAGRRETRTEAELDSHATSLVMRRLPQHITIEKLVEILRETTEGRFDFVHVPHDQHTGLNVALAFVNFVDHDSAARAYRTRLMRPNNGRNPVGAARIRPGVIQGLGPNLAYFIVRFGLEALEGPSAPHVFVDGRRVLLTVHTLHKYVTMDMLKSQLYARQESDSAVSPRIEDQFSWLFPTDSSASATAAVSLSGQSTSISNVQAWLDGHRSDFSSQNTREQADSNAVDPSSRSDLSGSSNEKDVCVAENAGRSPGQAQGSRTGVELDNLSKYREGGMTVFQL